MRGSVGWLLGPCSSGGKREVWLRLPRRHDCLITYKCADNEIADHQTRYPGHEGSSCSPYPVQETIRRFYCLFAIDGQDFLDLEQAETRIR